MVTSGATQGEYSPDGSVQRHRVALDLLYWAMHLSLHQRIVMTIKLAREGGAFFLSSILIQRIIVAKQPWYGQLKKNPTYTIVHYYVFI